MFELVAIGGSEFALGFRLAGIKTIETENPEEGFRQLIKNPEVGIIITDEKSISKMPEHFRYQLEGIVKPVTVVLSLDTTAQDALRKMIIKSVGVDLWKE
jgi:vacuolar-type H+-ATPase subunit F/Vma7